MRTRGKATPRPKPYRSKLEADYAEQLEWQRECGAIVSWEYEPEKLRLADGTWYTPDFRVVALDETIEFHETKGYMREAARVRLNVAADRHPYRFKLVTRPGGKWKYTII